ncbi:unnamed protein product [Prorocentrum cordatum]|uniref:Uncharacterized protein n=1 Tax=Prorocentrum cordatum TaxID=2364126 RepID=A0ABN9RGN6_9DINO|nr:unnamed protein product [Polarella glacialis]
MRGRASSIVSVASGLLMIFPAAAGNLKQHCGGRRCAYLWITGVTSSLLTLSVVLLRDRPESVGLLPDLETPSTKDCRTDRQATPDLPSPAAEDRLRDPPEAREEPPGAGGAGHDDFTLEEVLRTPLFWLIWVPAASSGTTLVTDTLADSFDQYCYNWLWVGMNFHITDIFTVARATQAGTLSLVRSKLFPMVKRCWYKFNEEHFLVSILAAPEFWHGKVSSEAVTSWGCHGFVDSTNKVRPMACWLTSGFFSLVALQGLLLAAGLGAVAVKFVRNPAGRAENEFLLDASRQIAGTFWAALVADPVRGLFTGLVAHGGDECAWYWVELVADATIGVWLAHRALRLYLWGLRRHLGPRGAARVWSLCRPEYFDEEGKPTSDIYGVYVEQLVLWLVALTTAKLVLAFLMMFEAVQIHALLRATLLPLFARSGHREACLVATRVVMQSVQYWLVDGLFVAVHGLVPDDPAQRKLTKRSKSRLSLMAGSIRGSLSLSLSGPLLTEEDDEEAALAAKERLAILQREAREAQEHLQRALEERARGAQEIEEMREQARAKKEDLERMSLEYQEEERKTRQRAEERARLAAAKKSPGRPESEQQQAKKKGCLCGGRQPEVTPRLEPVDQPALRLEPVAPAPARVLPWSAELPEPFAYAGATGAGEPVELPGFAELRAACGLAEADFQASLKELLCQAASSGGGAATRGSMVAERLVDDEAKTFRSIRDAYMVHVRLPANSTGSRFGSFLPRYYGMYINQIERATYVIKVSVVSSPSHWRALASAMRDVEYMKRTRRGSVFEGDRAVLPGKSCPFGV